ncbi:hypothetical protein [Hansschlegelia sp. KR7-227]|uniref:hypothetical protein n=1 Tax=Hansschlegelia sp. KR7-227 TaxID=3400914 RepID=UPI003C0E626D
MSFLDGAKRIEMEAPTLDSALRLRASLETAGAADVQVRRIFGPSVRGDER